MALVLLILACFFSSTEARPDWGLRDGTAIVGRKFEYELGDKDFRRTYKISKVVERGTKKLPDWLSYDTNTSLLVGVPLEDDVGTYAIRMKALCVNATSRDCPDKISRSFLISVFESLTAAERGSKDGSTSMEHEQLFDTTKSSHDQRLNPNSNQELLEHELMNVRPGATLSVQMHESNSGDISSPVSSEILHEDIRHNSFSLLHSYTSYASYNYINSPTIQYTPTLPRPCRPGDIAIYATFVLHIEQTLTGSERVILLQAMSKFISKDINSIFLSKTETDMLHVRADNKHIFLAGPGNVVASLKDCLEISWHLECGHFEHASKFGKVLQHNIDVGRITSELGYGVVAWYLYSDRAISKRDKRNANSYRGTQTPTMPPPSSTAEIDISGLTYTLTLPPVTLTTLPSITKSSTYVFSTSISPLSPSVSLPSSILYSHTSSSLLILDSTTSSTLFTSHPIISVSEVSAYSSYSEIQIASTYSDTISPSSVIATSTTSNIYYTSLSYPNSETSSAVISHRTFLTDSSLSSLSTSTYIHPTPTYISPTYSDAGIPSMTTSVATPSFTQHLSADITLVPSLDHTVLSVMSSSMSSLVTPSLTQLSSVVTSASIVEYTVQKNLNTSLSVGMSTLVTSKYTPSSYVPSTFTPSLSMLSMFTAKSSIYPTVVDSSYSSSKLLVSTGSTIIMSSFSSVSQFSMLPQISSTGSRVLSSFIYTHSERALSSEMLNDTTTSVSSLVSVIALNSSSSPSLLKSSDVSTSVSQVLSPGLLSTSSASFMLSGFSSSIFSSVITSTKMLTPMSATSVLSSVIDLSPDMSILSTHIPTTHASIKSLSNSVNVSIETIYSIKTSVSYMYLSSLPDSATSPSTPYMHTSSATSSVPLPTQNESFSPSSSFYPYTDVTKHSIFTVYPSFSTITDHSSPSIWTFSSTGNFASVTPPFNITSLLSTSYWSSSLSATQLLSSLTSSVLFNNTYTATDQKISSITAVSSPFMTVPSTTFAILTGEVLSTWSLISSSTMSIYDSSSPFLPTSLISSGTMSMYYSPSPFLLTPTSLSVDISLPSQSEFIPMSSSFYTDVTNDSVILSTIGDTSMFSTISYVDSSSQLASSVSSLIHFSSIDSNIKTSTFNIDQSRYLHTSTFVSSVFFSKSDMLVSSVSHSATSLVTGLTSSQFPVTFSTPFHDTTTPSISISTSSALTLVDTAAVFSSLDHTILTTRIFSTSHNLYFTPYSTIITLQHSSHLFDSSTIIMDSSTSKPSHYMTTLQMTHFSTLLNSSIIESYPSIQSSYLSDRPSADVTRLSVLPTRITPSSAFRVSETVLPTSSIIPTAAPDDPPVLTNQIEELQVHVGRYFEFMVPTNTFNDTEDGNTRNLSLSARLVYGKPLPPGSWLKFNETRQTFYGIPLWQDVQDMTSIHHIATVTLIAMDTAGQVAKDVIPITYNKSHLQGHTHIISITFNDSFTMFNKDRENLVDLGHALAGFYGDNSLKFITFLKLTSGSIVCAWSNNSLSVNVCCKDDIQAVFDKLVDANGSITEELVNAFHPMLNPVAAELEFLGICLLAPTTLVPPPKPTVKSDESSMWLEIILPILVAILVLVIIILILLVFCRHKRPRKESGNTEKSNFLEDRRPIIFPEELEMVDPSLKAKQPLVLPSDYIAEVPPVPPHKGKEPPTYTTPAMDDELFGDDRGTMESTSYGSTGASDPPAYRLPPPYFNPHRNV